MQKHLLARLDSYNYKMFIELVPGRRSSLKKKLIYKLTCNLNAHIFSKPRIISFLVRSFIFFNKQIKYWPSWEGTCSVYIYALFIDPFRFDRYLCFVWLFPASATLWLLGRPCKEYLIHLIRGQELYLRNVIIFLIYV
jgi:hypothetical protein